MPTARLHARSIARLAAVDGKRTEYQDQVVRGLRLRVTPAGSRTFIIAYKKSRRWRRYKLGTVPPLQLAAARAEARKLLAKIQLGEDPAAALARARGHVLSVQKLVEACLADLELKDTTRNNYGWLAKARIYPKLGSRPAAELEQGEVYLWAKAVAREAPYVANRALEVLHRSYTWAIAPQRALLRMNPCAGVQAPTREKASDRVLSAGELAALERGLESIPGAVADVVWLLLYTCARENMVLSMREDQLEDLDGKNARWVIPAEVMKEDEPHVVPIVPAALGVIRRRLEVPRSGPYLFPDPTHTDQPMDWTGKYNLKLRAAVNEAWMTDEGGQPRRGAQPMPKWTVHNLRHSISTHLTEDLGVSVEVTSLLLSHVEAFGPRITRRYNRARLLPQRRVALLAWSDWLARLNEREERGGRLLPMASGAGVEIQAQDGNGSPPGRPGDGA